MAIIQGQELYLDGYHLSADIQGLDLMAEWAEVDDTTLNKSHRSVDLGQMIVTIGSNGIFTAANSDIGIDSALGLTDKPVAVVHGGTDGDIAYFFKSAVSQYQPYGQSVGDLHGFNFNAAGRGLLHRGIRLTKRTSAATSADSDAIQHGAVSSSQKVYAGLFVFAASASDTLDVIIESDAADDFSGNETTRITFDQVTAIGSQWKEVSGAITDDWWRVSDTIGGTDPSFDYLVVFAIA